MNAFHLTREHQITSTCFKCPWRNAAWKKSSRSRKHHARTPCRAFYLCRMRARPWRVGDDVDCPRRREL